jgi:hypothetical protein
MHEANGRNRKHSECARGERSERLVVATQQRAANMTAMPRKKIKINRHLLTRLTTGRGVFVAPASRRLFL